MKKLVFILGLLLMALPAQAATRNCTSVSFTEVNAAVNGTAGGSDPSWEGVPAANGDTVNIPAGSATWTSQLLINKTIVLAGAGMLNTVITSTYTGTSLSNFAAIRWFPTISPDYTWGPRGFTLNYAGGGPSPLSGYGAFYFNGNSTALPPNPVLGESAKMRMTDIWIKNTSSGNPANGGGVWTNGVMMRWTDIIGLVDHCIIDTQAEGYQWGLVYNEKWGGKINSHGSYELPVKWGTDESLYFEDCWLVWGGQDAHEAARYVARHCRFTNGARPLNHGTESHPHGCRAMEVYQNWTDGVSGSWAEHRSGSIIVHDNIIGGANATYSLQNHRNFARKNGGSTRGENPSFATQTLAEVGAINNAAGYSAGFTGTINVDGFPASVVTGDWFQIVGETPNNTTHEITGHTEVSGDTKTITFTTALASDVADNAVIIVLVPPLDKNAPLVNDSLEPSDSNEPINGNVAIDEYNGTADVAMPGNTATMTDNDANWVADIWKTAFDTNYALNKGYSYQLVNVDDIRMSTAIIVTNTDKTITVPVNPGATTVPLSFTAGQRYAIRKIYAGADQPGMGMIKAITGGAWLANTNAQTGVTTTANLNSSTGTKKIGWPNQHRDPNYGWNNWTGASGDFNRGTALKFTTNQGQLVLGRDFFETQKPETGTTFSWGYPVISSPTPEQRQVGAAGITGISNTVTLYQYPVQSGAPITGLTYPHPLTGSATGKIIQLEGDLVFGNAIIGEPPPVRNVTVRNVGDATLTISSVSYTPVGIFSGPTDSFAVGPGATFNVAVSFDPDAETDFAGLVTFNSDATSGANTMIATGHGVNGPNERPYNVYRIIRKVLSKWIP